MYDFTPYNAFRMWTCTWVQIACGLLLGVLIAQVTRWHWAFLPLGIALAWWLDSSLLKRLTKVASVIRENPSERDARIRTRIDGQ